MARTKVETPAIKLASWDEVDMALSEIAIAKSKIEKEEAAYNEKEQKRRAEMTEAHAGLRGRVIELELGLKEFCEEHRSDFGKAKSKELQHGTVNFRLGTPKVEKVIKTTWDGILELVKRSKYAQLFVRTKDELNKEAIIDNAAVWEKSNGSDGIDPKEIREAMGVVVGQEETFGYDVKLAVGRE